MKYIIYLALFAIAFGNLNSLEPELYNPEGVTFADNYFNTLELNNEIYVVASDDENGSQIWKFDGSNKGMVRVTNLPKDAAPLLINVVNGLLLFATSADGGQTSQLWSTDGGIGNEKLLVEYVNNYSTFTLTSTSKETSCIFEGNYYTTVYDKDKKIFDAWVTDGTRDGTYNYSEKINLHDIVSLYKVSDKFVVLSYSEDPLFRFELNQINAEGGVVKLADFKRDLYSLFIENESEERKKLFFYDNYSDSISKSIWVTDGSKDGTLNLFKVNGSKDYESRDFYIKQFDKNYFVKYKNYEDNLGYTWRAYYTDGTLENSYNLSTKIDKYTRFDFLDLDILNGKLLYWIVGSNENQLWSTNGTDFGTKVIYSEPEMKIYPANEYLKHDGKIYSSFFKENKDYIIIETGGKTENTKEIIKVNDYLSGEVTYEMFVYNTTYKERIFFSIGLDKLFSYNPNTADFQFIQDIPRTRGFRLHNHSNSLYLTRVENSIYYFNDYRSMFTEISPEDAFSDNFTFGSSELFFNNYFYFLADYYDEGYKLYRIDNTFQTVSNVEDQLTDELKLYPNPTGDFLIFSVDKATSVSIIDLTGKVVMSIDNYSGGGINTSQLPTGVYNIILDENTYGGKFVKE